MDAELAGEAAFADPPPGAADRVLKGVLATVATGATVAGTATAGAAAAGSTSAATGTALWIKGLMLTGLVAAGGVGISQLQSDPVEPEQPASTAQTPAPKVTQIQPRARANTPPSSVAPSTAAPIVAALAAPETQAPAAPKRVVAPPKRVVQRPPSHKVLIEKENRSVSSTPARRKTVASAPPKPRPAARPAPKSSAPSSAAVALVEADTKDFHRAPTGLPRTDADLRVQRSLLTGALAALRAGSPDQAQRRLRDYRRRFGVGRLDQEHRMIAIRAHLAAGERDAAREAARAFITRYPQSALRGTVERLVR